MVRKSGLMAKMKSCPVCGQKVGIEKLESHVKKVHPREKVDVKLDEEEEKVVKAAKRAAKPTVSTRGRWFVLIAILLIVIVVLAFVLFPRGLGVGDPAPDFTLTDTIYSGAQWNLASHVNGGKPILLEFFHPQCDACENAVPDLRNTIYSRYGASIEMVSVAITLEVSGFKNPPDVTATLKFKNDNQCEWTFIVEESGTKVRDAYQVTSTPTFYLVGTDGKIAYKQIGEKPGDVSALEDAIKNALR